MTMKTGTSMVTYKSPLTRRKSYIQKQKRMRRKELREHYKKHKNNYKQKNPSKVSKFFIQCPHCKKYPGFDPSRSKEKVCHQCNQDISID